MAFQAPNTRLNPRMRVTNNAAEPILFHKLAKPKFEVEEIAIDLLDYVGLSSQAASKYPMSSLVGNVNVFP